MLATSIVQFPLTAGTDEGVDPLLTKPGTLKRLRNCMWRKDGRLDKRDGTQRKTKNKLGGGTISSAKRLFTRGTDLGLIDTSGNLYSYSEALTSWKNIGSVPNLALTWRTILDPVTGVGAADAAVASTGTVVHAYVTGDPTASVGGSLFLQITTSAGATLLAPVSLDTTNADYWGVRVLLFESQSKAVVISMRNPAGNDVLNAWSINLTTMAISAVTTINGACMTFRFDAVVTGSNSYAVTYTDNGTANVVVESRDSTNAAIVAMTAVSASFGQGGIGIDVSGASLFIAWGSVLNDVRYAVHNSTTLVQTSAEVQVSPAGVVTAVQCSVCAISSTQAVVVWSEGTVAFEFALQSFSVDNAGTVDANSRRWTPITQLTSKPFLLDGEVYCFCTNFHWTTFAPINDPWPSTNILLVKCETSTIAGAATPVPHRYEGKADVLLGGINLAGHLPAVTIASSTSRYVALPFLGDAPQQQTIYRCGSKLVNILTGASLPEDHWSPVEMQGEVYIGGSLLLTYDGSTIFDSGFIAPVYVRALTYTGVGTGLAAGVYKYAEVDEYRSFAGVLHRGPPALFTATVPGAAPPYSVTIPYRGYNLSRKQSLTLGYGTNVASRRQLATYRTVVGGQNWYRLTYDPTYNTEVVDQSTSTNTFVDSRPDTDIDGAGFDLNKRPILYTQLELAEYAPPSSLTLRSHRSRLFALTGDKRTIWLSKDVSENPGIWPGFSPQMLINFDVDLVGMSAVDEKFLVFSEDNVWVVAGQGPTANGDNSDYSPVRIQSDVGCTSTRSLVELPDGVMFQHNQRLYMLDRGLTVKWVGKPVEDTLTSYPVITSAVLVPYQNQVRFTCNNEAGTEGVVIVFDYFRNQWSVFEYTDGSTERTPIADSIVHNGAWTFVTPGGTVYAETSAHYLDGDTWANGGKWVYADGECTDISAGGPMSYQRCRRIYLLGQKYTDCDLTMRVAINGSDTYGQERTWDSVRLGQVGNARIGVHVKQQKSASVRVRFSDGPPTGIGAVVGTGQGINLSAIGFEIGIKKGLDKRPATARQ